MPSRIRITSYMVRLEEKNSPPILGAMKFEICSSLIGFAGILTRLAEVAAAMVVRGWMERGCENSAGLSAALEDPRLARTILAIYREPGRE